ncbi:MAG: hypothetical protein OEM62_11655 [Acidobacteriota bacterium]|nr:hypothetical protein [Acidobacteriota bacterium]
MKRDWIPTVAGVLQIVSAICALIGVAGLVFASLIIASVPDIQNDPEVPAELIGGLLVAAAGFVLVLGLISLIGGICGIRRSGWGWSIAGSIAAVFLVAPAGILALVLTIVGEKEFIERGPGAGTDAEPVVGRGL